VTTDYFAHCPARARERLPDRKKALIQNRPRKAWVTAKLAIRVSWPLQVVRAFLSPAKQTTIPFFIMWLKRQSRPLPNLLRNSHRIRGALTDPPLSGECWHLADSTPFRGTLNPLKSRTFQKNAMKKIRLHAMGRGGRQVHLGTSIS